jgi:hypothetical protein
MVERPRPHITKEKHPLFAAVAVVLFSSALIKLIVSPISAHGTPVSQLGSPEGQLVTYQDPAFGVSFQYPANWQDVTVTTLPDISIPDPTGLVPRAIVALAPSENIDNVRLSIEVRGLPTILGQFNHLVTMTNLKIQELTNLGATIVGTSQSSVGGGGLRADPYPAAEIFYYTGTLQHKMVMTQIENREYTILYTARRDCMKPIFRTYSTSRIHLMLLLLLLATSALWLLSYLWIVIGGCRKCT